MNAMGIILAMLIFQLISCLSIFSAKGRLCCVTSRDAAVVPGILYLCFVQEISQIVHILIFLLTHVCIFGLLISF